MSKLPISTILGLAVSAAAACGPESSHGFDARTDHPQAGGNGGAAAMGGSGGAVVADGGNGDAASDSGLGGTGGTDDAGPVDAGVDTTVDGGVDVQPETCGPDGHGCAKLSVPLTDPQTGTFFPVSIPTMDLSGVSVVFRFCLVASAMQGSGWVQPYAQEGVAPFNGQYDTVPFASIPACPTFLDYTFNFSNAPDPASDAGSPWFTRVPTFGLKIQSLDGATGSWANPTVVYVDSIMLYRRGVDGGAPDDGGTPGGDGGAPDDGGATRDSGALPPLPGPFTFDTSGSPFSISPYQPVAGSALDWVP
jgi:hypothetical protein